MPTGRTPPAVVTPAARVIPARLFPARLFSAVLLAAGVFGAAVAAGGCTHAEYDIVRPANLAQHVGTKDFVTFGIDPIEYRMVAYEDHLVIQAHNRSSEPIQLLADQSTVVDPRGQSHPLAIRNQTILPGSFTRLALPPVRSYVAATGPTIGIGIGTTVRYDWHSRYRYYPYYRAGFGYGPYYPYYGYYPRYYAVYAAGDANVFWDWPDKGEVHLVLVYLRNPMGEGPAGAPLGPPPPTTGPAADPATRPADAGPAAGGPPPTFGHEFTFVMKKV